MNFFKKFLKFGIYAVLAVNTFAFNIGIAPTGFYTSLDKNETHEVVVTNNTMQTMRIEIDIEPDEGWEKYDMKDWMRIYPKSLSLKPNGSRSVRFAVKRPQDIAEGEYKTKLVFREISSKPSEKKQKFERQEEVAIDFELLTEIHVAAYGLKGKRVAVGELLNSEVKKQENGNRKLIATFNSKGNSALAVLGDVEFLDAGKKRLDKKEIKIGMTRREGSSQIETELNDIPKNSKYIRVNFKDKSGIKLGSKEMLL